MHICFYYNKILGIIVLLASLILLKTIYRLLFHNIDGVEYCKTLLVSRFNTN